MVMGQVSAVAPFPVEPIRSIQGADEPTGPLVIAVSTDGRMAMAGAEMDREALVTSVAQAVRSTPERRVEIKADSKAEAVGVLDLVALATVADVAPLVGVNRALVRQGLKVMAQRQRPGLVALADVARLDTPPSSYTLGFVFGPRVNAGGRIGAADLGNWTKPIFKSRAAMRTLNGRIDEFAIYASALSEEEIRTIYNEGKP